MIEQLRITLLCMHTKIWVTGNKKNIARKS